MPQASDRSFLNLPAVRYGGAVLLAFGAAWIQQQISPLQTLTVVFVGAVALAARWLGFGPAILCTVTSIGVLDYFFIGPRRVMSTADEFVRLSAFAVVSILIASVARQRSLAESIALRFGKEKEETLQALADRDERLRIGLTVAGMGTWRWEVDAVNDWRDASFNAMIGLAARESIQPAKDFFERVYPEDRARVQEAVDRMVHYDADYDVEFRMRREDGTFIWVRDKGKLFRDLDGKPLYITGAVIDITDRKLEQEELQLSRARFKRLFDVNMIGICFWGTDGKVIEANDEYLRIVGVTREEFEMRGYLDWRALTPVEYRAADERALRECMERGVSEIYEKEALRRDGKRVPILVGTAFLSGSRFDGIAFVMDLSERKTAELALLKQEKLASAGRLAATIAHEINNPLEAVTNLLYLARSSPDLPAGVQQMLKTADEELQRVTHTAKQTLGFYRESTQAGDVDLVQAITDVVSVYGRKLEHRKIDVQTEFRAHPIVHAFGGELRQIFSNVINNAADAMPGGGRLRIRVSHAADGSRPFVRVTVCDEGTGIDREQRPHIFEPFFTTKRDVGTGLGLWVTKQLVEKHGGRISVRSTTRPDRHGTVFSIVLPERLRRDSRASA
jgi:PAS domain S-box-containing protein